MLRSPTYSLNPAPKVPEQNNSVMGGLLSRVLGSSHVRAYSTSKKESTASPRPSHQSGIAPGHQPSFSQPGLEYGPSKAQSSLASSNYQAHGFVPRFDDSDRARPASLYNYKNNLPPPQVRVNLPPCASYETLDIRHSRSDHDNNGRNLVANLENAYHIPVGFGYDGGADAPGNKDDDDADRSRQQKFPHFDFKGVTHADFEVVREDHDNTWHRGRVDDFFRELAANEAREIARIQGSGKKVVR